MPPVKQRSPWESIDEFPPPYCRLLAKEQGGGTADMAVTNAELAIRSGIPIDRIADISRSLNWDGVSYSEMRAFFLACNFDPTNAAHRARVRQYHHICKKRKTTPFQYLRHSPKWETEFHPLYLIVMKIMRSRSESLPATAALATLSPS